VLQVAQPDHEPDRNARPAHVWAIEFTEALLDHAPIQQAGPPYQCMAPVDLLAESGPKEVVGWLRIGLVGPHRNHQISMADGRFPAIYNVW
jgi:hypothetical protein